VRSSGRLPGPGMGVARRVVVAYPSIGERYGLLSEVEGLHEFAEWIQHLRDSAPLELGKVRGRSSYGAARPSEHAGPPVVKWAQCGDWAALARGWYRDRMP
jgi:hypothetical protein